MVKMNNDTIAIGTLEPFSLLSDGFTGRGLTGDAIIIDKKLTTNLKAGSRNMQGDIDQKHTTPEANPERPTFSKEFNTITSTAEEIANLSVTVATKIKEQETIKEAYLDKFKKFTNLCLEFRNMQTKLNELLSSELPNHPKISVLFKLEREAILNELQNEFFVSIDSKINAIKADLDYNYETQSQLTKFMVAGIRMARKKGDLKPNTCAICYDRQVDGCLVPCGHTFCISCSGSLSKCPMCTSPIQSRVKMFLST